MELNKLLIATKERDASDLHITVGVPPVLRINGKLQKMDLPVLDAKDVHEIISGILTEKQKNIYQKLHEFGFSYLFYDCVAFPYQAFDY